MTAFVVAVAYVLIWRICVLACGLVAVILGYRLFKLGFAAHQGDLSNLEQPEQFNRALCKLLDRVGAGAG